MAAFILRSHGRSSHELFSDLYTHICLGVHDNMNAYVCTHAHTQIKNGGADTAVVHAFNPSSHEAEAGGSL